MNEQAYDTNVDRVKFLDNKEPKKELWWVELIRFSAIALIVIIPIRMYIMQPFIVSGESMIPTFENRDYLIIDELTYKIHSPHRGDVIVFRPPNQPKGIFYIKRVIGLPGETVHLEGSKIIIREKGSGIPFEIEEPYITHKTNEHVSFTIPEDEVFVMGDNRPRSSDSRSWGTLPIENITGRAYLRLFPFTHISYLPGAESAYTTKASSLEE